MDRKQLLKILIAAAWIDGEIQESEHIYLHKMATQEGLLNDPEIKLLLLETKPVPSSDCYRWLKEYLGGHPKLEDYQQLIESLSAIIYSDGDVKVEEAELLNSLQQLDPSLQTHDSFFDGVLDAIGKFYRRVVYQNAEPV